MKWRGRIEEAIVEVAIGQVKGFFYPSEAERAAAYELLVELTTRPSSAQLSASDVSISDELASIEEMFGITRSILRKHGAEGSKGSAGNLSLAVVALRVLNEVFRPVVNRWGPLLDDHTTRRPTGPDAPTALEWELRWERGQQCRVDLNSMRASTRAYIETLSRIAGASSVADAVLSSPTSTPAPTERVETSLRPASTPDSVQPRHKMVQWLDLVESVPTARSYSPAKESVKQAQDRPADVDRDEAGRPLPSARFDAVAGEDFWFDYVADMGDGFDGTAPVAWLAGRRTLHLSDRGAGELPTPPAAMPRGQLLVFGGDEVYPFAAEGWYESQTELPYRMGLEGGPDGSDPMLIAIPGNHDWMGGVEHFEQMFVSGRRFAEHWQTVQRNNFWHVKLPQGWWLWGIDTGLDDELVGPQEEYFRGAADLLRPGDRVVLCTPVPLWQLRQKHPRSYARMRSIFDPLIAGANASMPLCLSGDTHAFAHLERVDTDAVEDHLMAGGGGAFLQPTHNLPQRVPLERGNAEFKLTSRWPPSADSRSLAPGGAEVFARQYWTIAVLLGLIYAGLAALAGLDRYRDVTDDDGVVTREERIGAVAWRHVQVVTGDGADKEKVVLTDVGQLNWWRSLEWSLSSWWVLALLALLVYIGMMAFRANSREPKLTKAARVYGMVGGLGAGLTMLVVCATWLDLDIEGRWRWPLFVAVSVAAGFASLAVFLSIAKWSNTRIHANDTLALMPASSTRYKHFLRFRIDQDGDLTCYAIGIDPVGAGWYEAMTPSEGQTSALPPYDPAGSARLHYVWGKTYRKFVPRPLNVALSVSDPAGRPRWSTADGPPRLTNAVEGISEQLILGGHTLMYGGRPDGAMTVRLHELDRRRHADNPNAELHLVNYVADHYWDDDAAESTEIRNLRVGPGSYGGGHPAGDDVMQEIANLTAMRERMSEHADLRVVIGGDKWAGGDTPHTRLAPGVLHEAYLALEAGVPLVVVGGFGGAAGLMADALAGRRDQIEIDALARFYVEPDRGASFVEMLDRFSSVGVLRNGLTNGENLELLRSEDPYTIVSLVMRSVYRLGSTR